MHFFLQFAWVLTQAFDTQVVSHSPFFFFFLHFDAVHISAHAVVIAVVVVVVVVVVDKVVVLVVVLSVVEVVEVVEVGDVIESTGNGVSVNAGGVKSEMKESQY